MPFLSHRSPRAACRVLLFGFLLGSIFLPVPRLLYAWPLVTRQSAATTQKTSKAQAPHEEWIGMYLGTQKIGYSSARVVPTTFQGKRALETISRGVTKMTVLGSTVEEDEKTVSITDSQYHPLSETIDVNSNGSVLHIEATFDYKANKVICLIGRGSAQTKKILTIPPGANLIGDPNLLAEGKQLAVGQKFTLTYLEPLSVNLEKATVEVTGRETVHDSLTGKELPALVLQTQMSLGKMTTWVTDEGDVIRGQIDLGITKIVMARETKEQALNTAPSAATGGSAAYTPPADFAVTTAITIDKPIDNPRRLRTLDATISGIPNERLVLSDAHQKAERLPAAGDAASVTAKFSIHAGSFDAQRAAQLPIADAALTPYLQKAAYLNTEDQLLRNMALKLRGNETNSYRVASAIRDWVHKSMVPDPSIGVPRDATDIYRRRRGVCRDYATLYTALARAAGIPTRLCGGIVYGDFNGKNGFFYHAWAESYVGEWVPFDPTIYSPADAIDYVDATHIKFAQGDVTSMFDVVAIIGKLQITVQNALP